MPPGTSILDLVGLVYDAVGDPARWSMFLEQFTKAAGADGAHFLLSNRDVTGCTVSVWHGYPESVISRYNAEFADEDPWLRPEMFITGNMGLSHHQISDEQLENTRLYREILQKIGLFYGAGLIVLASERAACMLSMLRKRSAGPFDERLLALLEDLFPHLNRAARMHGLFTAVEAERDTAWAALDALRAAAIVIGPARNIVHLNRAAEHMLQNSDLLERGGKTLVARHRRDDVRLQHAITAVLEFRPHGGTPPPASTVVLNRPDSLPVCLTVSCLGQVPNNPFTPFVPRACIFLRDLERSDTPPAQLLTEVFTFTRTENAVAGHLLSGSSITEIAGAMFVSEHTIRTHIKHTLGKTGARRQAELVRLLAELAHTVRVD